MEDRMSEEKPLFLEKELNRWKRPGPPKLGSAFVFVGECNPLVSWPEKGEFGPTPGEIRWGKFRTYYEVDTGERLLEFQETLPCADEGTAFEADVKIIYKVSDPIVIVQRARTDAGGFLRDIAVNVMRRAIRSYKYDQLGDAENAVADTLKKEVFDNGFEIVRSNFVTLSLDAATKDFAERKLKIEREARLKEIEEEKKLAGKEKRAKFFGPLIQAGNWQQLLAMLDPNDPEYTSIQQMITAILEQNRTQEETRRKMFEIALEKGALEDWQLGGFAKALFQELSGISDKSLAFLEGKPNTQKKLIDEDEKNRNANNSDDKIPDEFKD
jgi:hypothetical protein